MSDILPKTEKQNEQETTVYESFVDYKMSLKRYISRFIHNFADVDDIAQETFLRAFNAEQGRKIERPKSFLFKIAKNLALTQLTQKSRQITDYIEDFDDADVLTGDDTVEDEVIARQVLGIHCEAVAELPPQCRRVYLMRKVYGMPHKEIAKHLGIAVSTVEKHLIKGVELCDRYVSQRTDENLYRDEHHSSLSNRRKIVE